MILRDELQWKKLHKKEAWKSQVLIGLGCVPHRYWLSCVKPHVGRQANFSGLFICVKEYSVFNFATKKRIFCSKHWMQQNTPHMEKVPLSRLSKALSATIIITWNSNTLSEPQSHLGMSSSLGLPSSETQRGSPFWW